MFRDFKPNPIKITCSFAKILRFSSKFFTKFGPKYCSSQSLRTHLTNCPKLYRICVLRPYLTDYIQYTTVFPKPYEICVLRTYLSNYIQYITIIMYLYNIQTVLK